MLKNVSFKNILGNLAVNGHGKVTSRANANTQSFAGK